MTDDRSHSLWLSTNPHPPISPSPTEAVLAQRTAHATGMSMRLLQHAHSRRSEGHSRSTRTTATPIHSLYSSHSSLTNAPTRSQQSKSSITRRAPSLLVRHHSTSTSSSGGNASATESFTPYTHMAGYFRQPSPAIPPQLASNYPVASLRSTSTSRPMGDSVHNAPGTLPLRLTRTNSSIGSGVILVDSLHASSTAAGQVQRVDVKRLMSKPRAVLPPSSTSSHSILSVPAHQNSSKTHASAGSSLSDDETADRKASVHPLTVGRRRRSRTMDELMLTTSMSIPVRPLQVNSVTCSIMTPTTPAIPTYSDTLKPHQAAGPSFTTRETTTMALETPAMADTVRPKEAINTPAAPIDYHMQRTTIWLDTPSHAAIPPARQAASLDLHRTSDLTPASALALAWNESQRRQPQPSPDSTPSQLPPPPPSPGKDTLPLPPSQDVSDPDSRSHSSYGHAAPNSFFDSSMRGGKVVAVGGPEVGVEDPYRMWAMVEEKLRQTSRTPTGGNPIKELRRRVTGRFSRGKDKNKEKERDRDKEKRAESMGALLPPSSYPTASSKPGVPQRRKTEFGPDRQPTGNLVIPNPRGSSLNALSLAVSWKSWGDATNPSNTPAPEFGSFQSQVTPTGSTMNVNRNEYTYSPQPSVPGSESSPTPAASLRMRSKSPAPSRSLAESGEGDTGRLWKLVRKLSNGALRQRLANEQGDSSVSAEDVPPVPALPKDFELVNHHAYISERNREHAQEKLSWVGPQRAGSLGPAENPGSSSSGTQSTVTMQSPPLLSSKNEQLPIPVLPTSPQSTSPVSPPRSTMSKLHGLNVVANISALNPHPYPPRSKHASRMPAHKPSASQQSITTSGNATSISGHEFSFRSASPGFSSSVASDVTSSKVMTSPYSQRSSVSSSSELNTTAVAIARHIMPPEELFRIRQEDPFARQVHSATGHGGVPSGRVQPRGPRIHIKHDNNSSVINRPILSSPTSPPPPSSSPVVAHSLTAPPRRQTLGNAQLEHARAQATHGQGSPAPTAQALSSRAKSIQDPPIPRPLSSPPGSPLIPSFAKDRPVNMFDDRPVSQHTQSISLRQNSLIAPSSSSSSSAGDSFSPRSRLGSLSSVNALSPPPVRRRVAKTNSSAHQTSPIARHIEGNISMLSPSARRSFPSMGNHSAEAELEETSEKGKKLWLNTSNSLLSRVRSRGVKSSGALQTLESSGTDPSPMTSKTAPARLNYKGKQRERSKSFVEVGENRTPFVPFTATAFAFRELIAESPVAKLTLSEQEREDRWAALLARSDRAGGTLTAKLEGGVLLSDTMSIAED